jgi:hypothetical protein
VKRKVKKLYTEFFNKTSDVKVDITFSEKDEKMIDNFIKLLPDYVDEDWLFDFMLFGFGRYADKETHCGKGNVQLNWVIGKKAIEAYNNKTEQQLYHISKFKIEKGINKRRKQVIPLSDLYLNTERSRFLNTERGFLHCKENLLSYETNKVCLKCKFKKICKNEK